MRSIADPGGVCHVRPAPAVAVTASDGGGRLSSGRQCATERGWVEADHGLPPGTPGPRRRPVMSEGFYRFTAGLPTQAFRAGAETGVTHFGDCPLGSERFAPRDSGGRSMPAKQNLMRAHDELFRRGPDEVFPSLQALYEFCQGPQNPKTPKPQNPFIYIDKFHIISINFLIIVPDKDILNS